MGFLIQKSMQLLKICHSIYERIMEIEKKKNGKHIIDVVPQMERLTTISPSGRPSQLNLYLSNVSSSTVLSMEIRGSWSITPGSALAVLRMETSEDIMHNILKFAQKYSDMDNTKQLITDDDLSKYMMRMILIYWRMIY